MFKFDTAAFQDAIAKATGQIAEAVSEPSLRAAGFAGAAVFRDEAIRNAAANKKTGVLMRNIIVKRMEEDSDGGKRQAYLVTVRTGKYGADGDAFYWRFVENGHKFVPRNQKRGKDANWKAHRAAADLAADARRLEYGTAGAPAYPFMRPAYESKKQEAADAMAAMLIQKLNEKLSK